MSGPYRVEKRSELYFSYIVVGPTGDVDCYYDEPCAVEMVNILNAAYAAGQAGGVLEGLKAAKAAVVERAGLYGARYEWHYRDVANADASAIQKLIDDSLPPQTSTRDGMKESV